MQALRTVIILIIGIAGGLYLSRYLPWETTPEMAQSVQPLPAAPQRSADTRLIAPTLTLKGRASGNLQSASLAIVVGNQNVVIAEIASFAGAASLVVELSNGQMVPIVSVLAADERYGIAALRTAKRLDGIESLQPESPSGSLYLGRDVVLLGRDNAYRAQVNSAAVQDDLGAYHYAVQNNRSMKGRSAAIIDEQSRRLLGLALSGSTDVADAIDIEPINQLLTKIGREPERSLDDYTRYYFNHTTAGRLALLRQLVATEQFDSAIGFGQEILNLDTYTQTHSTPLLYKAYTETSQREITQAQWRRAIQLLSGAEETIGLNDELRLLRVEAYQAIGELEPALNDLLAMTNPNDHLVRKMVIENLLASGQDSNQSGLALLERAMTADPDFAPYHRLMGEALARQGNLGAALASLEMALNLDPAMANELAGLLQRLRARRDAPPLTEVPIQRHRSTLYVNVRVNGSNQTFRFLFDTGASYTAITSETALRLGINNIFFGAPVIGLETANGRVYTTTATLDSIDVGGARVNQVEAVILESMGGVDGLLGQSFLRHFDIDINRTRGVIAFNRRLDE